MEGCEVPLLRAGQAFAKTDVLIKANFNCCCSLGRLREETEVWGSCHREFITHRAEGEDEGRSRQALIYD